MQNKPNCLLKINTLLLTSSSESQTNPNNALLVKMTQGKKLTNQLPKIITSFKTINNP